MRKLAIKFAELGILPDYLVRKGIRIFLNQRLKEICISDPEQAAYIQKSFVKMMQSSEIAPLPAIANQQHYEVPTTFFKEVLGSNLKYSSCYWNEEVNNLDEAESLALSITCQHADLQNGMEVLELGCGWGSLTLWIASHYPNSKILGISNSVIGLVLVHTVYGIPFTTLFFRNFYVSVPTELVKAARIDGAGFFKIFFKILLPISAPIIVVTVIWQFTQIWNDFLFGSTFSFGEAAPIQVALNNMVLSSTSVKEYNVDMASAIIAGIPTLIVYVLAGKYFIRGLTSGAVKG